MGFLYCQNTDCNVYIGSLGGSSCAICGWQEPPKCECLDEKEAQPVQPKSLAFPNSTLRPAQPAVVQQDKIDAERYEYIENHTRCETLKDGSIAWVIHLPDVLVGRSFGIAIDAALATYKEQTK